MSGFFKPNLEVRGRVIRGLSGLALAAAGVLLGHRIWWVGMGLVLVAGFVLFEAVRGWCVMRACGIRTRW